MMLSTIALAGTIALAQYGGYNLCGSPCDPQPPTVYGQPYAIPQPYYPPAGYGVVEPPHNPAFDPPSSVSCVDLGNGFVSCTEY